MQVKTFTFTIRKKTFVYHWTGFFCKYDCASTIIEKMLVDCENFKVVFRLFDWKVRANVQSFDNML